MTADIGLGPAVLCAGLWPGLLLTLTTILHPIYAAEDARGFALALRGFLPVARRSPTNYLLVIGLVVAPAVALFGLRAEPGGAPFVFTAVGLRPTIIGPVLVVLVAVASGLSDIAQTVAAAVWDLAFVEMGAALLRRRSVA